MALYAPAAPAFSLHLLNVLLHGSNASLAAFVGRRLGLASGPALLAGLLFLTYPASPEAVAWCSGMPDDLLTTAALASVLAFGSMRVEHAWSTGAHTLAWLVVALMTKETGVAVPALWFVVAWSSKDPQARIKAWVGSFGIGIALSYAVWRLTVAAPADYAQPPDWYLLKELARVVRSPHSERRGAACC